MIIIPSESSSLISIEELERLEREGKADLSVAYELVYTEGASPRDVPEKHSDLWIRLCRELRDALVGMLRDIGSKITPMYIRNHLCTNVLDVNERLFRVLRAVLLRTVSDCPDLPDEASLKRELLNVKSAVKTRMENILKKLLQTCGRGDGGGGGGGGGRSSPSGATTVKWQKAWDGLFSEVWTEALAECGWCVVPPLSLSVCFSDRTPHHTPHLAIPQEWRAQSVQG